MQTKVVENAYVEAGNPPMKLRMADETMLKKYATATLPLFDPNVKSLS